MKKKKEMCASTYIRLNVCMLIGSGRHKMRLTFWNGIYPCVHVHSFASLIVDCHQYLAQSLGRPPKFRQEFCMHVQTRKFSWCLLLQFAHASNWMEGRHARTHIMSFRNAKSNCHERMLPSNTHTDAHIHTTMSLGALWSIGSWMLRASSLPWSMGSIVVVT